MSKELSTNLKEKYEAMRFQAPVRAGINTIKLDNSKLDKETGETNKNFGKLYAYRYEAKDFKVKEVVEELDITKAEFYLLDVRDNVSIRYGSKYSETHYIPESAQFRPIQIISKEGHVVEEEGKYKDLKEKYDLSYAKNLYVSYGGHVYRWTIKPSSFESLFPLLKQIEDLSVPKTFKVSAVKSNKSDSGSIWWNEMEFELAGDKDMEEAVVELEEYRAYQQEKQEKLRSVLVEEEQASIDDLVDEAPKKAEKLTKAELINDPQKRKKAEKKAAAKDEKDPEDMDMPWEE